MCYNFCFKGCHSFPEIKLHLQTLSNKHNFRFKYFKAERTLHKDSLHNYTIYMWDVCARFVIHYVLRVGSPLWFFFSV